MEARKFEATAHIWCSYCELYDQFHKNNQQLEVNSSNKTQYDYVQNNRIYQANFLRTISKITQIKPYQPQYLTEEANKNHQPG